MKVILLMLFAFLGTQTIAQQKPIELTGDYKQDMLLLTESIDAAHRRNAILKNRIELYRKSQVTGHGLMLAGAGVAVIGALVIKDNQDASTAITVIGGAMSLTGFIIMLDGHKHLKIKSK